MYKILSYWLCSYRQKKSFRYTPNWYKIGLWQIFQQSIFVPSCENCHDHSHWIHKFRFFFSYFGFLHSSTWPSGAKGEWRVSSWLVISNTRDDTLQPFFIILLIGSYSSRKVQKFVITDHFSTRASHNDQRDINSDNCCCVHIITNPVSSSSRSLSCSIYRRSFTQFCWNFAS